MTDITSSHAIQLIIALSGAIIFFLLSYLGLQRQFFKALLIIIPFQLIDSQYGSLNMALTYVLGASMLFSRKLEKKQGASTWPLILPFCIIFFAYLLSWTQAPSYFNMKNLLYLVMLFSNVVLFYMTYHFIRDESDIESILKILFTSNGLVIAYCILQLLVGFGHFSLLGIEELSLSANRADNRLAGPFNAVGITAEYLVIQCLLIAHYSFSRGRHLLLSSAMIFCNIAILIGTGNRGGFLSFFVALILFTYNFRKKLGGGKIIAIIFSAVIILTSASFFMIQYTDFNILYDRLLGTEMKGFTPDTRSGWDYVVEKIWNKPILGHGPRLVTREEIGVPPQQLAGKIDFYPHSLYLYILYTMGMVGLLAYSTLWVRYITGLAKINISSADPLIQGMKKIGLIVFFIFLFDQLKVECLRFYLLDYQHYIAATSGMFYGLYRLQQLPSTKS